MRLRLLLLFLPVLLGACAKTNAPVRLDFIGTAALTSGSKVVRPTDTLTTRAYAVGNDNELRRLRVTLKHEPTRNPFFYPTPLSSYKPKDTPNDDELVYLDSVLVLASPPDRNFSGRELLFQNKFAVRSTSGTELWRYTATDAKGQSASRAYRLTARKPDSAAVVHSYAALLRPLPASTPPAPGRDQARVFLSLRSGLLLPKYALINVENSVQANQQLIDLVAVARNNTVSLIAPKDVNTLVLNAASWPVANRRATQLRQTGLSATDFNNAATDAALVTAFTNGLPLPDPFNTGPLAKGQVLAFAIAEGPQNLVGLLLVSDLVLGTSPTVSCLVKIQK